MKGIRVCWMACIKVSGGREPCLIGKQHRTTHTGQVGLGGRLRAASRKA